jgi:L-amino acid N-acyltransferase YncA
MTIRIAETTDAQSVLSIYSPFILHSPFTFENEVPGIDDFQKRMAAYLEKYPWLVSVEDGQITGYAYASKHRERKAYQWCVESSIYIHPDYQRGGTATKLYSALLQILRYQGFYNVYAVITTPNIPSETFHARLGFSEICIYRKIGFKLNQWHDVKWMVLALHDYNGNPEDPVPFQEIRNQEYIQQIIKNATD